MSLDFYMLCHRPLSSIAEWQAAIDATGFDLKLHLEYDIAAPSGYLPAARPAGEAGFECSTISLSDLEETYEDREFGGPWACIYAFYLTTMPSCAGVWIAMAACLSITGGVAFDPEEDELLTAEQAVAEARKMMAIADGECERSSA